MNGPLPMGMSLYLVLLGRSGLRWDRAEHGLAGLQVELTVGRRQLDGQGQAVGLHTREGARLVGLQRVEAHDPGHVVGRRGGGGADGGTGHAALDRSGVDRLPVGKALPLLEIERPLGARRIARVGGCELLLHLSRGDGGQRVEDVLRDELTLGLLGVVGVDGDRLADGQAEGAARLADPGVAAADRHRLQGHGFAGSGGGRSPGAGTGARDRPAGDGEREDCEGRFPDCWHRHPPGAAPSSTGLHESLSDIG